MSCETQLHRSLSPWARELLAEQPQGRAAALRRARKAAHLTQEELARRSGYCLATVQRLEYTGRAHPHTIDDICSTIEHALDGLLIPAAR